MQNFIASNVISRFFCWRFSNWIMLAWTYRVEGRVVKLIWCSALVFSIIVAASGVQLVTCWYRLDSQSDEQEIWWRLLQVSNRNPDLKSSRLSEQTSDAAAQVLARACFASCSRSRLDYRTPSLEWPNAFGTVMKLLWICECSLRGANTHWKRP